MDLTNQINNIFHNIFSIFCHILESYIETYYNKPIKYFNFESISKILIYIN